MRKRICSTIFVINAILFLFTGSLLAQSYNYVPTLKEGNTWVVRTTIGMGSYSNFTTKIQGDTIFNGVSYKKVYYENHFRSAMREDTIARRMYSYVTSTMSEYPVRDYYNLEIGDSTGFGGVINSIDTVFIYNRYRRILRSNNISFIEGVGVSLFGLFVPSPGTILGIVSFTEGGATSTVNAATSNDLKIYPNPAFGSIYIESKTSNNLVYELYNTQGLLCGQGSLLSNNTTSIDVTGLPSSMYFLNVIDKKTLQKYYQKIIIQD